MPPYGASGYSRVLIAVCTQLQAYIFRYTHPQANGGVRMRADDVLIPTLCEHKDQMRSPCGRYGTYGNRVNR